jgi:signal transduction histidine kinase
VFSELGRDEVSAIARATDGSIDVATVKGLWQVDGGRITRLPDPPVPLSDAHAAQALLRDGQGRLWLSQRAAGVFVLDGQHWKADPVAGLDPGAAVFMYRAPDDVLWFAYPGNRLARLDHGLLRYFDAADGLAVGDVLAIASVDGQLWIGGEKGVAHFEGRGAGRGGGRFRMLGGVAGGRFGGVSGIVGGNDGALWLNGASGIQRIAQGQLTPFLAGADSAVDSEQFDDSDGTGGAYARFRPLPSISASDDGQLWFLNSRKIVTINPAHIVRNKVPPAIRMTALDAGGIPYLAAGMPDTVPPARVRLPQHTQSLSIGYTALSLSTPERIRFRYRLDGVDTGWQEAGTRRTAYYTNLAPGSYRFHLSAANEDGVWNTTGTALDFTISPAYYQTVWFRALLGAAALVLLWALYRQRSRLVEARRQGQLAERERIARELHDTLLQSTQGLIFGFHAAVGGLPRELPARDAMERILDRAETVLKEARDGVHGLRSEDRDAASDGENSLVKRILARLPAAGTMPVHVVLKGQPQPLKAALYEDACAIAGEAIGNAMRHSHGSLITLTIQYGCRDLSFSVVDDGVGLPEEVRVTGGRSGHWGLAGMRERAGRLRATLVVDGARGQGAEVRWRVPAAVAYSAGRCAGRHGWAYLRCRWDHRFEKRD